MKWLMAILVTSAIGQTAAAHELIDSSPTLSHIVSTGEITIGHRSSEIPFSYLVNGQPTGYAIDLCLQVIEGLEKTFELGDLKVTFVPVTPANRFIMVRNGEVDIECGVTTNTPTPFMINGFYNPSPPMTWY